LEVGNVEVGERASHQKPQPEKNEVRSFQWSRGRKKSWKQLINCSFASNDDEPLKAGKPSEAQKRAADKRWRSQC
jgi:hypothetical protein